jgi:thiamine-phosphate pyrophosphorylase
MSLLLPRLYGVTDEALLPGRALIERVRLALMGGLRLVQVRFKTTARAERLSLGRELRAMTSEHGALLIVNDRPELAADLGADGVHVGAEDVSVERARELLGPDAIVGMSAYGDEALVRSSIERGATYVGLSSPYPSPTKDKPSTDVETVRHLAAISPVPTYAIGGITFERAARMTALGCHGVAVVSALFGAQDVTATTRRFVEVTRGPKEGS